MKINLDLVAKEFYHKRMSKLMKECSREEEVVKIFFYIFENPVADNIPEKFCNKKNKYYKESDSHRPCENAYERIIQNF